MKNPKKSAPNRILKSLKWQCAVFVNFYDRYKIFQSECWHHSCGITLWGESQIMLPDSMVGHLGFSRPLTRARLNAESQARPCIHAFVEPCRGVAFVHFVHLCTTLTSMRCYARIHARCNTVDLLHAWLDTGSLSNFILFNAESVEHRWIYIARV